jgi:hypothetical protein
VRSTPAGARVRLDGRDVGQTPLALRDLSEGAHQIQVVREGYAAAERRVMITRGNPARSVTIELARAGAPVPRPATPATVGRFSGALFVESRPPGANVFLDGTPLGTTPMLLDEVRAGEHAVRLERDGYRRWTASVRVIAGERNRVTASLER